MCVRCYFLPFEHCKFSAEQREGSAHELSDLGVWEGRFHTRAHVRRLAVSLADRMLMFGPAAVAGLEVCQDPAWSASPAQMCARVRARV